MSAPELCRLCGYEVVDGCCRMCGHNQRPPQAEHIVGAGADPCHACEGDGCHRCWWSGRAPLKARAF